MGGDKGLLMKVLFEYFLEWEFVVCVWLVFNFLFFGDSILIWGIIYIVFVY